MFTPEEIRTAKKRVKSKKDFYQHLMTYVIINCFLILLNLLTSSDTLWFFYPLLGWGIGLLFHYVEVFGIPSFGVLSQEWEEQELENELRQIREQQLGLPPGQGQPLKDLDKVNLKREPKDYDESKFV